MTPAELATLRALATEWARIATANPGYAKQFTDGMQRCARELEQKLDAIEKEQTP